jgi:hypothetical protein
MRKVKLFLCLQTFVGCAGLLSMPDASAQTTPGLVPPGIQYVRTMNYWSQTFTSGMNLTGCPTGISCTTQTVTLNPGPAGVDTTTGLYQVYINDASSYTKSEAVTVIGGTCTVAGGAGNCTITFVPYYSHTSYTIGSASSGIQEAINVACGTNATINANGYCNVTLPANGTYAAVNITYAVYGTIFLHTVESVLSGYGATLECDAVANMTSVPGGTLRGPCIRVGPPVGQSSSFATGNTIQGITFRTPNNYSPSGLNLPAYYGSAITQTSCSGGTCTVTTAASHGLHPGDLIDINFTDNSAYWGDSVITTVPSSTTFTCTKGSNTIASQPTPGVVALEFSAVLDAAEGTNLVDLEADYNGSLSSFNNFFDFWDDENATITHFNNNSIGLNSNVSWNGSFVYSGGNPVVGGTQWAPVITLRDSTITAVSSSCVTDYNSNGLYIENTVCQGQGLWEVYSSNTTGNLQGAYLKNIYSEANLSGNPSSPAKTPFPGLGVGGLIVGASGGNAGFQIHGSGTGGAFATGPAPAPITAASESGTTVTISSTLNPGTGTNNVTITGVTPSGYNGTWSVTSSTSTSFQFSTSPGLTPGTAFGTAQGAIPYTYYVVAHDTTTSTQTSPMQVLNWLSTGNDSIPVQWPRIANAADSITYDVIRMATPVGLGGVFPFNGGCTGPSGSGGCGSVQTGILQAMACSNGLVCSYTDSGSSSTSNYAVLQGNYAGTLNFWPGALVVVGATEPPSVVVDNEEYPVVGVSLSGNPIQTATWCTGYGVASSGAYTTCLASRTQTNGNAPNQTATILTDGGAETGVSADPDKGRLNFSTVPAALLTPHHIITLIDSQPGLTQATSGYRPPANQNDTWIGTDAPHNTALSSGQLAFGAPKFISNYIGNTGDNASWLERLTASSKTFAIPVSISDGSFGSAQTSGPSACETGFGITTLSTGGTTTNTGQNCLPANAIIDSVVYRIITTITTATSFTIGDSTTATRFCATQSVLSMGTTGICFAQADQTGASGPRQTSAASVRVTTNVSPSAGTIRLIVYYHTWNAPTS